MKAGWNLFWFLSSLLLIHAPFAKSTPLRLHLRLRPTIGLSRRQANLSSAMVRGGSEMSTNANNDANENGNVTVTVEGEGPDVVVNETAVASNVTMSAFDENEGEKKEVVEEEEEFGVAIAKKKFGRKLRNRNSLNIKRKVTHAMFGLFFASLNQIVPRAKFVPGMTILTGATLFMELMRYRRGFGWMNHALHFVLGSALRKQEMEGKFTGSFYYFLGVTTTAHFFPGTPATLGIIQLALADPSASYFGRQTRHIYWSRIENGLLGFGRNKGVLGFLGGALFCVPFNYLILSSAKWSSIAEVIPPASTLLKSSLFLGLSGAFADLAVPTPALTMPNKVLGIRVPPFHVDDNFVVPLFSAFACTEFFKFMGWSGLQLSSLMFTK